MAATTSDRCFGFIIVLTNLLSLLVMAASTMEGEVPGGSIWTSPQLRPEFIPRAGLGLRREWER